MLDALDAVNISATYDINRLTRKLNHVHCMPLLIQLGLQFHVVSDFLIESYLTGCSESHRRGGLRFKDADASEKVYYKMNALSNRMPVLDTFAPHAFSSFPEESR